MAKFYLQTAEKNGKSLKYVVEALDSCYAAMELYWYLMLEGRLAELGKMIFANETGHDSEPDTFFPVDEIRENVLKKIGRDW